MVKHELRVIYGDTDKMGVVYYGTYMRFLEAGRNEFIRAKGIRYREFEAEFKLSLPVVEVRAKYKESARYDDLCAIETSLVEINRASLRFDYKVLVGDRLIVDAHTVHACVDREGRVRRLPQTVIDKLTLGEMLHH